MYAYYNRCKQLSKEVTATFAMASLSKFLVELFLVEFLLKLFAVGGAAVAAALFFVRFTAWN